MKHKILLLIFLTIPLFLSAQSVSIGGIILDEAKIPFPGVFITLLKDGNEFQSVQSDSNGNYSIKNIEPGKYDLKISYILMRVKIISNIEITEDKKIDFTYPEPCTPVKKNMSQRTQG